MAGSHISTWWKQKQEKWAESNQRGRSQKKGKEKSQWAPGIFISLGFELKIWWWVCLNAVAPNSRNDSSLHAILLVTGSIILPRSGPNTLSAADRQRHNGPLLPTWRSAQTSDGDGNRGVVASPPKAWGDKCLHLDIKTLILCLDVVLHKILF